jgi:uncharacterized membrane protein YbhN (UPF0104 family)
LTGSARVGPRVDTSAEQNHARRVLRDARRRLQGKVLKLVGFVLVVYAVLKLVPALKEALRALEHASWGAVLGLLVLEVLSETGYVVAWSAIVDPQNQLTGDKGGRRTDQDLAWAQLAGGLVLPGGSWGGLGIGAVILHRFGMPTRVVAERELSLTFLNTAIDALALVVFGVTLATGLLAGEGNLLLTLLPAALAGSALMVVPLIAPRLSARATRRDAKHHKIAETITTLAAAVEDTKQLLSRGGAWTPVLGITAYFACDVMVLWCAFLAVHANPVPAVPVVIMAYIIGALGGSIPLPAAAGTIGGIAGMLILYGVGHNVALAAVLLHQAIALLVPLIGGSIAYVILRRRFGPLRAASKSDPAVSDTSAGG